MSTNKMLLLSGLDEVLISSLVSRSGQLKKSIIELSEMLERSQTHGQIVNIFEEYDLGKVIDVHEIFGGYVNRSFGVTTEKNGQNHRYFVRLYKLGITENEIELEHSLIDYSIAHGLDMAAGLIRANDQKTFVKFSEDINGNQIERFGAIYDFLPGEDKYTWDNPTLNDEEYASSASVLATFHNAARDFDPRGRKRAEPKIMEFLPMLPGLFKEFLEWGVKSKFHAHFLSNIDQILSVIERTKIPDEDLAKLPQNPIHSDYHPGNLKFKDNKVVGIFDFDWSKIDLRLFDVCLALVYTCSSWQSDHDGTLLLDKSKIFLESYQKTLQTLGGLTPLNEWEIKYLPTMLAAANMYLISWSVNAYYHDSDLNVYEYLAYLKHNVRIMKWIDDHKEEILKMAMSI